MAQAVAAARGPVAPSARPGANNHPSRVASAGHGASVHRERAPPRRPCWSCRSRRGPTKVRAGNGVNWFGISTEVEANPLVEITEENYDDFITQQGDRLVVVDFYAEWCKPCKKISPMVRKLARKHPNVVFASYLVDKSRPTHPKSLGLTSFPTFFMYKNGEKIGALKGSTCVGELMSIVGSHNSMDEGASRGRL